MRLKSSVYGSSEYMRHGIDAFWYGVIICPPGLPGVKQHSSWRKLSMPARIERMCGHASCS